MIARTKVFDRMGLALNPRTMVRELDASYKQIVEIARALLMEASIIIMDEPTTSLTEPEIQRVFDMMRTLQKSGVGIVFISHKLREVMEVCTRFTVLRDGSMVSAGSIAETSVDQLARDMVGHAVRTQSLRRARELGGVVLSGERLTLEPAFRDVSFSVRAGEVLGFTGLLGDGRSELVPGDFRRAALRADGAVSVSGRPRRIRSTVRALKAGIGYVPRNRKENGIIKDMSILENGSIVTWPRDRKLGLIDKGRGQVRPAGAGAAHQAQLDQGPDRQSFRRQPAEGRPGQVADRQPARPRVRQPDAGRGRRRQGGDLRYYPAAGGCRRRRRGAASEAQEIIRVCDRTLVMFHGSVCGELVRRRNE